MKSIRSLAKMPRDDRVEKPNRLRMKRNRPSRFLDKVSRGSTTLRQHLLETGNIIGDFVEEQTAEEGDDDGHDVMRGHQERVSSEGK